MKKILIGADARKKLLEGCRIMAAVVGTTYSPKGRNVTLGRTYGLPIVVHDGVTAAKEVEVEDEFVELGIDLIREAATKQVSDVGDGTTLTTILADSIVNSGMELLEKGVNPMVLRKQIEKALPRLTSKIKEFSQEVKTAEQIRHVAYVSSNDEQIADAVSSAVQKVGSDGLITPELSLKSQLSVEYAEGLELDRGWGNYPHFVTNPDRMEAIIEDVSVLILGRKVTTQQEMQLLIEAVVASGSKNMLFIGEVSGDALSMVLFNKIRGNISALVVSPPNYGDSRKDALDDIALITGARVVVDEIGMKPEQFIRLFNAQWIGTTKTVLARKMTTNIIKYEPSDFKDEAAKKAIIERNRKIKERIESLRALRDSSDSPYDKEKIQERIAKLTTGVAVIKVGAKTDTDAREKLERVKDAIPAAQAAVSEGIVPGGAVVLLQLAQTINNTNRADSLNDGEKLLYDSLQQPIKKLLENAGEDEKAQVKILEEIKQKGGNYGYNCETGKVEDLLKSGVIDPAKVIRLALENAVAVASSILTCDALIAIERPKEKDSNMVMA